MRLSWSDPTVVRASRYPQPAGLSRREFIWATAAAGGLAAGYKMLRPAAAFGAPSAKGTGSAAPKPIPWVLPGAAFGDPNNHHPYHILPPLAPGTDGQPGQYTEPITITDFKGFSATAIIDGTGTGTPTQANPEGRYNFNVDMRMMKGVYVGVDGKQHEASFGFV
jgi:hypothetical protein